jgi:hypothetical protein
LFCRQFLHLGADPGVKRTKGFIQQHNGAIFHQSAGKSNALTLATGQTMRLFILMGTEANLIDQATSSIPVKPLPPQPCTEKNIINCIQPRNWMMS